MNILTPLLLYCIRNCMVISRRCSFAGSRNYRVTGHLFFSKPLSSFFFYSFCRPSLVPSFSLKILLSPQVTDTMSKRPLHRQTRHRGAVQFIFYAHLNFSCIAHFLVNLETTEREPGMSPEILGKIFVIFIYCRM